MDRILPISDLRQRLPDVVREVADLKERYVITRQGRPAAVLISAEELETLEVLADPDLVRALLAAEEDIAAGRIVSHAELFPGVQGGASKSSDPGAKVRRPKRV